jgi:NADH-quinone oxidoreductase subunit D
MILWDIHLGRVLTMKICRGESMYSPYVLNFGPQHPAAHGLLRLVLQLDGEVIKNADPHIGFLHRGIEKLIEQKTYSQIIGYVDRLDYVAAMSNEHCWMLALEKLLRIEVPIRVQYIRVLLDEMTRILSHLLWVGSHALDIGAMSVFLYAMQQREKLIDVYEAVSGSRMHPNYYRPGGLAQDLPASMPDGVLFLDYLMNFTKELPKTIDDIETMLTDNRIWKKRTVGVGVVDADKAIALGFTGPMLRGSGVDWDLRKKQPYAVYDKLEFAVPIGKAGDCYSRYLVHVEEMRQSVKIMQQCVNWLRVNKGVVTSKAMSLNKKVLAGEVYAAIEHPKGEFGIYLIADGTNKPYRVKFRAASFPHLAGINELAKGHMIADVAAIISSTDILFGEIDR